jgi:N-succinyldiaminopimelate aminotransferase
MSAMARRIAGFGTTVFVEINDLARRFNAVNLGQGAPSFDGPPEVLAAAIKAINGELNQYAPGIGMPALREAIARHAARFYAQKIDPETNFLITSGATEAVFRRNPWIDRCGRRSHCF